MKSIQEGSRQKKCTRKREWVYLQKLLTFNYLRSVSQTRYIQHSSAPAHYRLGQDRAPDCYAH